MTWHPWLPRNWNFPKASFSMNLLGPLFFLSLGLFFFFWIRRRTAQKDQSMLESEIEKDFREEFEIISDSTKSDSSEGLLNWMEEEQMRDKIERKVSGREE